MADTVLLTHSEHVCRVITTVFGAVLVSVCAIILFLQACRWINKALDNRQYRLETDRKERIERARHNIIAEREGWRQYDEFIVAALAGYAKENHQMREFMKKTKVKDLYEKEVQEDVAS
jgi:mannitol-specific phosphotransferase system IIBC component